MAMIPKECKRLAEVDFPIAEVSKHSAREKSIRHGHPSTLHLWWARRPLAACRAMLLGLLLPDPCDRTCPEDFKERAQELLKELMTSWKRPGTTDAELRQSLLSFIAQFADWDNSDNQTFLRVGHGLVKAAHGEEPPLVVDPFAGGGSIPLEALRLGCEAFASDLNPVACLILKVMLEDIPRHGPELAEELRRVGGEIKKQAEKELAEFYPKDPDGATPMAYLWARTVRCESPNCGAEIPLMRSFWLCTKANRKRALRHKVVRPAGEPPRIEFEIFRPKTDMEVLDSTVARAKATCLCCNVVLSPERVRAQLVEQHGGADTNFDTKGRRTGGAIITAVVTLQPDTPGRNYRLPTERDYQAVWKGQIRLKAIIEKWERNGKKGICPVPDEPTPVGGGSGAGRAFSVQRYGMLQWGDLFTARQKVALATLTVGVSAVGEGVNTASQALVAIAVNKTADLGNALAPWKPDAECPVHLFARQAIGMAWDFAESVPSCDASGSFESAYQRSADALESVINFLAVSGQVQLADAAEHPLPNETSSHWFTDPPYYDAVPYADLSDFFLVWLKRALPGYPLLRDPFDPANPLLPKRREAVQDETKRDNGRSKDRAWFEETMAKAFTEGRRVLREEGIGSVVFAHKTTEGWEALLSGMIRGGWTITGSWPIATEMGSRLRARESAALATSVHLVCRPRPANAAVGDWAAVLGELPKRVCDWMERLQSEGVRGADLVFACIGPALEIFSRHSRIETADGREVKLAEYMEKVWEVVGRSALEQVLGTAEAKARNGAAGAVEEDARLTALFLWTLQATNGQNGKNEASAKDNDEDTGDEDEVWGGYRFAVIADGQETDGLKTIDLGAGHSSGGETLCGRVITALKSQALLNESVGAGYIERNWPPVLKESGAWPLTGLRQSFLNGSLTRLLDPDTTLRGKVVEFVGRGDFGLASGQKPDGTYERVWFQESVTADEVAFESGVFLLAKVKAQALKAGVPVHAPGPEPQPGPSVAGPGPGPEPDPGPEPTPGVQMKTIRLVGAVPHEVWNRLGTKVLPKLRSSGSDLKVGVDFSVTVNSNVAESLTSDLHQIMEDLGLANKVRIE